MKCKFKIVVHVVSKMRIRGTVARATGGDEGLTGEVNFGMDAERLLRMFEEEAYSSSG